MIDREKVIKGLEYHLKEISVGRTCFECPYCGNNPCEIHLIADAIVLLKEQEAEQPIVHENSYGWKFYYCPKCKQEFYQNRKQAYCDKCGKAVRWK